MMTTLTTEKPRSARLENLQLSGSITAARIAVLEASGTPVKRDITDYLGALLEGRVQLNLRPESEREIRLAGILSSFYGVNPTLERVLEIDGRRSVYVPVPPEV